MHQVRGHFRTTMTPDGPVTRWVEPHLAGPPKEGPVLRNCPKCGGRGVVGARDEFGNYDGCGHCEATGINPDHPDFPA